MKKPLSRPLSSTVGAEAGDTAWKRWVADELPMKPFKESPGTWRLRTIIGDPSENDRLVAVIAALAAAQNLSTYSAPGELGAS